MTAIEQRLFEPLGDAHLGCVPVHDVDALALRSFETVGQLMILSLVQGGPPPNFMAAWVYTYLCAQDLTSLSLKIEDIADMEIRQLVTKVGIGCDTYLCSMCAYRNTRKH